MNNEETSSPILLSSSDSSATCHSPDLPVDEEYTSLFNRFQEQPDFKPTRITQEAIGFEQVVSSSVLESTREQSIAELVQLGQLHGDKSDKIVDYLREFIQIVQPGDLINFVNMHCGVPLGRGGYSCDCGGRCLFGTEALRSNSNCTLKALEALGGYFEENDLSSINCGHVIPSVICVNGRPTVCPVKSKSFERCPKLTDGEVEFSVGILQIFLHFCDSIGAKVFVFSLGGTTTGCEKILTRLCESFPDSKNVTIHSRAIQHAQFMRTNLPGRSLVETAKTITSAVTGLSDTFEKHREKCGRPKSSQTLIDYLTDHSEVPLVAPNDVSEEVFHSHRNTKYGEE